MAHPRACTRYKQWELRELRGSLERENTRIGTGTAKRRRMRECQSPVRFPRVHMSSKGSKGSNRSTQVSKKLSWLLRHGAIEEGLAIRTDGLALLTDVMSNIKATRAEILEVTGSSDKQRFAIVSIDGKEYIRANQGHSIPVPDLELKRVTSVDDVPKGENGVTGVVVHGTYKDAWKSIKKQGLSKMTRNHIHFAIGTPGESHVISGMRSTCQVLVYVDLAKALADGIDFFLSENHVVLSPGNAEGLILPAYFKAVLDATTEQPFDTDFPGTL